MSTRESSAVLGSPMTCTVTGTVLLLSITVIFSVEKSPSVPLTVLLSEQRFRGWSLKICPATKKVHINTRQFNDSINTQICTGGTNTQTPSTISFLRRIIMNHTFRYHKHTWRKIRLAFQVCAIKLYKYCSRPYKIISPDNSLTLNPLNFQGQSITIDFRFTC